MALASGDKAVDNAGRNSYPHIPHSIGGGSSDHYESSKELKNLRKRGYPQYTQPLLLQLFCFYYLTNDVLTSCLHLIRTGKEPS
jgi:hypothetical protein